MPEFVTALSAIGALLTAIAGFYVANSIRKKNEADAAESLTLSAMKMLEAKDRENESIKADQILLRTYAGYLDTGIRLLQKQLRDANIIPCFDPTPLEDYKK